MAQLLLGAAWIPTWFFLNLYLQTPLTMDDLIELHEELSNEVWGVLALDEKSGPERPRRG